MGSHGGRRFKLEQTYVVLNIPVIIALVHNNSGNLDVLLVSIISVQVVGTDSNTKSGGRLTVTAVGSGHNPVRADQRATTHQGTIRTTTQQHDLMGELTIRSCCCVVV